MKAYDYPKKVLNKCNLDPVKTEILITDSLVRLTKNYSAERIEEIITKSIKGDIFLYVYFPEHTPTKYKISTGFSFQIMQSIPTINDLPEGSNGMYVLIKSDLGAYSAMYFVNGRDSSNPIENLRAHPLTMKLLAAELYPSVKNSMYVPIAKLSFEQWNQIKLYTTHIPMALKSLKTWKNPPEWHALTPSQLSVIISNPKSKTEIIPWHSEYGFDMDDLWVSKQEADELLLFSETHFSEDGLGKNISPQNTTPPINFLNGLLEHAEEERLNEDVLIINDNISKKTHPEEKSNLEVPPHKSPKKRNRGRSPQLMSFVTSWIIQGFDYSSFRQAMLDGYLFKTKPNENEAYDEHDKVKRVYLVPHSTGHTVHFSEVCISGVLKQKRLSLVSFKRIFIAAKEKHLLVETEKQRLLVSGANMEQTRCS